MNTSQQPQSIATYPTRDLYLSVVFTLCGLQLLRIENHAGKGVFIFKASDEIDEIITRYYSGELRFDPKNVFETWKTLKSRTYSTIGDVR